MWRKTSPNIGLRLVRWQQQAECRRTGIDFAHLGSDVLKRICSEKKGYGPVVILVTNVFILIFNNRNNDRV